MCPNATQDKCILIGRFPLETCQILRQPLQQGLVQLVRIDRLGDMVVHAGGEARIVQRKTSAFFTNSMAVVTSIL